MAHACRIYQVSHASHGVGGQRTTVYSKDINNLLTDLESTVRNIPPFAFVESSLVWVYFVAATNSELPTHQAFYASRLAELLQRIGHGSIKRILTAANIV